MARVVEGYIEIDTDLHLEDKIFAPPHRFVVLREVGNY